MRRLAIKLKIVDFKSMRDPLKYLLSDSDDKEPCIGVICVPDGGSKCHYAKIIISGVALYGIVDSGATTITIMGSNAFKQVATVAKVRKWDFKPPDKALKNYDLKPFHVDGKIKSYWILNDDSHLCKDGCTKGVVVNQRSVSTT